MSERDVKPLVHICAGASGAFIGVTLTSPLELLKTRQQSTVSRYSASCKRGIVRSVATNNSLIKTCREIIRQEGYRSLFKGLTPSLAAVVPGKATYFTLYSESRNFIKHYCNHGYIINVTSGTIAGLTNALLMNPFWVVKTKIQLDEQHTKCTKLAIRSTISKLYKTEGVRAFYRGATASLAGSLEGGVYFLIYEELKLSGLGYSFFSSNFRDSSWIPTAVNLSLSACISKVISNTVLYPTEVVRTRLREDYDRPFNQRKYRKFWRSCYLIHKEEGLAGLYGGWVLHLYKTIPFTIITFLVYEGLVRAAHSPPRQLY